MNSLGKHILVEFNGCDPEILNDVFKIESIMKNAAEKSEATIINTTFHHFSPIGVSGVVVIQESHLAIHTWPEYRYAALDIFTCGDLVEPWESFDYLKLCLKANNYSAIELLRGSLKLLERFETDQLNFREITKQRISVQEIKRNVWFTDRDENIALSIRYTGKIYFEKKSHIQNVRILESEAFGKMLTINNTFMCTERDEANYHEMIAHPAIFTHGRISNALIIGGGDGGTARELLRHNNMEEVTLVEIDKNVIDASREHLPTLSSSFNDPRLKILVADGIKYIEEQKAKSLDMIIVDSSDPVGQAEGLFTKDFYMNTYNTLKENGVLVIQGESPYFNTNVFIDTYKILSEIFGADNVKTILFHIPSYPSGTWSFHIAHKDKFDPEATQSSIIKEFCCSHQLKYYNEEIHYSAFCLPTFVKDMLSSDS